MVIFILVRFGRAVGARSFGSFRIRGNFLARRALLLLLARSVAMGYLVLVGVGRAGIACPPGFLGVGAHYLANLRAFWLIHANGASRAIYVLVFVGSTIVAL